MRFHEAYTLPDLPSGALALVIGAPAQRPRSRETKLAQLKPERPVELRLMNDGAVLRGRIDSIARGITDRDGGTGRELLADVNPTFNWVRLAQRVPVRIRLDPLPPGQTLVAGTSCTVVVGDAI